MEIKDIKYGYVLEQDKLSWLDTFMHIGSIEFKCDDFTICMTCPYEIINYNYDNPVKRFLDSFIDAYNKFQASKIKHLYQGFVIHFDSGYRFFLFDVQFNSGNREVTIQEFRNGERIGTPSTVTEPLYVPLYKIVNKFIDEELKW